MMYWHASWPPRGSNFVLLHRSTMMLCFNHHPEMMKPADHGLETSATRSPNKAYLREETLGHLRAHRNDRANDEEGVGNPEDRFLGRSEDGSRS